MWNTKISFNVACSLNISGKKLELKNYQKGKENFLELTKKKITHPKLK